MAHPAAKIHPAGIFEAVIPASAIGLAGGEASLHRVSAALPLSGRRRIRNLRPLCFSSDPHRLRSVSFRRGHALPEIRKIGRARARSCGRHAEFISPSGRRTRSASAWSAISIPGTGAFHPMRSRGASGIWEIFCPGWVKARCTNSKFFRASGAISVEIRSLRILRPSCAPRPRRLSATSTATNGTTPRGSKRAPSRDWLHSPMSIYEIHARLLATQSRRRQPLADLSRARRRADSLREADGLHAYRTDAHHGASLRRVPGATRPSATSQ